MSDEKKDQTYTGALEAILLRDKFYYDNYRGSMRFFLFLLLLIGLLITFVVIQERDVPRPVYFATKPDASLIDLMPVSKPNVSDEELMQWATTAAIISYDYNFVNFRTTLQELRSYFTARGHKEFLKALKKSNNLESVKVNKLLLSPPPPPPPSPPLAMFAP